MTIGNHTLPTELLRDCSEGFLYCIGVWAYNVTDGLFWTALLLGFCFALYMATFRYGTTRSFGFASITGLFGAVWLAVAQLMPWWIASAFILVGVVGVVGMVISER